MPEGSWVSPIADDRVLPLEADPATLAEERESIRLAFIAALRHLPARQRAVLVLCEVLRWQASEAAALLDTSVPAVNSALQRARATLATLDTGPRQPVMDAGQRELLARYIDAFERFDVEELVGLLHKDAVQSMPPYAMWLLGSEDIGRFMLGPGHGCRGSKLVAIQANGSPAFEVTTNPVPRAATSRGPSWCSKSRGPGSPGSIPSSRRTGSSPSSGCHSN